MKVRTLLVALATALAVAPAANAAGWKQLTASDGTNIEQVGLVRTADGVLHVVWHHRSSPNTDDLLHTAIAPNGRIGATSPIASSWANIENAAVVVVPNGLLAVWGGIRTTQANEPNQDLNYALSTTGGVAWSLHTGSAVPAGAQAYGSPVSVAVLPDGTPLEAWAGSLGTWVHAGLDPSVPNHDYQAPLGIYGYDAGIAADTAGRAVLAWYSNATGHLGVQAQDVAADGAPVGAAATMPNTSDMQIGMLARTPLVARRGGGFYVAYPTGYPSQNRVRVWRVGAAKSKVLGRTTNNSTATLAASDDGRLWLAWTDARQHVLVRRSDPDGSTFGATVDAGKPKGAASVYRLDASDAGPGLDLFGLFTIGTGHPTATFHRRILAGLTLKAKPARLPRDKATRVTFTVLDAGDPVKGAKVKAGGRSGRTSRKGKVRLKLDASHAINASVSAKGYAKATRKLRLKR
jgi:hypothetical protein